jgi:hypothetical protein
MVEEKGRGRIKHCDVAAVYIALYVLPYPCEAEEPENTENRVRRIRPLFGFPSCEIFHHIAKLFSSGRLPTEWAAFSLRYLVFAFGFDRFHHGFRCFVRRRIKA